MVEAKPGSTASRASAEVWELTLRARYEDCAPCPTCGVGVMVPIAKRRGFAARVVKCDMCGKVERVEVHE